MWVVPRPRMPRPMGRWGVALGPEVLKQVHECVVRIARDKGVTAGRRMRVDTTVVETDIHHPTDSTLLGDGVRVLTRIMRKIATIAGAMGTKLRDRSRSVKLRLLEIGRVARAKGPVNQDKLKEECAHVGLFFLKQSRNRSIRFNMVAELRLKNEWGETRNEVVGVRLQPRPFDRHALARYGWDGAYAAYRNGKMRWSEHASEQRLESSLTDNPNRTAQTRTADH